MKAHALAARLVLAALVVPAWSIHLQAQAVSPGASDATALVGLARTARDQGRYTEAAGYFRDANQRRPFDAPLLVEYFWVAHRADAATARELGTRILAGAPRDTAVRDGLIGLLVAAGDEDGIRVLARAGASLDPSAALWPRRLAESHLRTGEAARAAELYAQAASLNGGGNADLAQRALALESSADKAAAAAAWTGLDAAVWSSRPEWVASRERALAAVSPPPRVVARPRPPLVLTGDEVVAASTRTLARDACATSPLAALERLPNPDQFIAAVAARRPGCADLVPWATRAAERAIGLGRFADALRIVEPVATADAPLALREQLGVLLHWTGDDARAEPVLREVVSANSGSARAAEALIDVLRGRGDSDAAWSLAHARWSGPGVDADRRLALAALALDTGRLDQALSGARSLVDTAGVRQEALGIAAGTLLAYGRPGEALSALGSLRHEPRSALVWLDAVASTEGVAAALQAAQPVADHTTAAWAEVTAHRALWHARMGQRTDAQRLLATLDGVAPGRADLARGEIALALGRPADALSIARAMLARQPRDLRALDTLSTAMAETAQWDDALSTLDDIRARRPHDVRWNIRLAEWRHRQTPSAATLGALETLVAANPQMGDGRSALARAYFRAGRHDRVVETLGDLARAPEHDVILAARALRASGRPDRALAVLRERSAPPVEMLLLRAEIVAAMSDVAAADAEFGELTRREDVDPAWYLAWADVHQDASGVRRVLELGTARFPTDPLLLERLAVVAWASRDVAAAVAAADAALAVDDTRTGAWFVKVEHAGRSGNRGDVVALLDGFERRFAGVPTALLGMGDMLAALATSPQDVAATRALNWTTGLLTAQPDLVAAVVTRARLLAALGHLPRALTEIDALVAARPDLVQAHKLQAELLASSGRFPEAVGAYDRYLALVPDDIAARRQQARIDGWRGATGASLERYDALRTLAPSKAIEAEVAAKRSYYRGHWREALVRYDAWLALEPDEVEALFERAQVLDHLGLTVGAAEGYQTLAARVPSVGTAALASQRLERRRRPSVEAFATSTSADGPVRRQVLDVVDAGAAISTGVGPGHSSRARVFGGPSFADARDRSWFGHHVGADLIAGLAPSVDLGAVAAYRKLDGVEAQWFGNTRLTWRGLSSLSLTAGVERSLVMENGFAVEAGLAGTGPAGSVRWQPHEPFRLEVSGSRLAMTDDNTRQTARADMSQRLWRGANDVHLVASSQFLAYGELRAAYFTPSAFWRHDLGLEWRRWLTMPRFFGDKERWISAAYLYGVDDRREHYHTARVSAQYELTGGASVTAGALVVRSRVYDSTALTVGLHLKHVPMPGR